MPTTRENRKTRLETAKAKIEELTRERDAWREHEREAQGKRQGEVAGWTGRWREAVGRAEAAEAQRDTLREEIESLSVECRQEAMTQRDDYAPTDNARTDAYARIGGRLRSLLTPPDKGAP